MVSQVVGDAAVLFLLSRDGTHPADGLFLGGVMTRREAVFTPTVPQELLRAVYDQPEHHSYFDRWGVGLAAQPLDASPDDRTSTTVPPGF